MCENFQYEYFNKSKATIERGSPMASGSGTKSILRFRGFGNTSSLWKLFFESLSVVFESSHPSFQFSKRRSVSKATKSEYRFCPQSDAIGEAVVSTISSRRELYSRHTCAACERRVVLASCKLGRNRSARLILVRLQNNNSARASRFFVICRLLIARVHHETWFPFSFSKVIYSPLELISWKIRRYLKN